MTLPRTRIGHCTPAWLHLFTALFPILCAVAGLLAAEYVIQREPLAPVIKPSPRCSIA
jgi:hypothetical protein